MELDYSGVIAENKETTKSELGQSFFAAANTTPDAHAEVLGLSKSTNVPPDMVARNIDEVRKAKALSLDYEGVIRDNPRVQQYLKNPDKSSLHRDNLNQLTGFDNNVTEFSTGEKLSRMIDTSILSFASYVESVPSGIFTVADLAANKITDASMPIIMGKYYDSSPQARALIEEERSKTFESRFAALKNPEKIAARKQRMQELSFPELQQDFIDEYGKGNIVKATEMLAYQTGTNFPTLVAGIISFAFGGPAGGAAFLGSMGGGAAGQAMTDSANSTAGLDARQKAAAIKSGSEMATEFLQKIPIIGHIAVSLVKTVGTQGAKKVLAGMIKKFLTAATFEGAGEGLNIYIGAKADVWTGVDPDADKNIAHEVLKSFIIGAASSGISSGPFMTLDTYAQVREARKAEASKVSLENMVKSYSEMKQNERLPGETQEFAKHSFKGSETENMVIKTEEFHRLFQNPNEMVQKLGLTDAYELGIKTGEIVIPTVEFLEKVAETPELKTIMDDFRFQGQEKSVNEVKADEQVREEIKAQAEAVAEEAKAVAAAESENPMVAQEQKILNMIKGTGEIPEIAKPIARSIRNVVENLAGFAHVDPQTILQNLPLIIQNAGEKNPAAQLTPAQEVMVAGIQRQSALNEPLSPEAVEAIKADRQAGIDEAAKQPEAPAVEPYVVRIPEGKPKFEIINKKGETQKVSFNPKREVWENILSDDVKAEMARVLEKYGQPKMTPEEKKAAEIEDKRKKNASVPEKIKMAFEELNPIFGTTMEQVEAAAKVLVPIIEKGKAYKDEYNDKISALAKKLHGEAKLTSYKDLTRGMVKVLTPNNFGKLGKLDDLKDILRSTIVVGSFDEMVNAIHAVDEVFEVVRIKDRFTTPTDDGYSDFLLNVRLPNGLISEVQINVPEFVAVKNQSHRIYDISRKYEHNKEGKEYKEMQAVQTEMFRQARSAFDATNLSKLSGDITIPSLAIRRYDLTGLPLRADINDPSGNLTQASSSKSMNLDPLGKSPETIITTSEDSLAKLNVPVKRLEQSFKSLFGLNKSIERLPADVHNIEGATVFFEVAPDPDNTEAVARWRNLTPEVQAKISKDIKNSGLKIAVRQLGIDGKFIIQSGGYQGEINKSIAMKVNPDTDIKDVITAAKYLGFVLRQQSMMVSSPVAGEGLNKSDVISFSTIGPYTPEVVFPKLWEVQIKGYRPFQGFSANPFGTKMSFALDNEELSKRGITVDEVAEAGFDALEEKINYDLETAFIGFFGKGEYNEGTDFGQPGQTTTEGSPLRDAANTLRSQIDVGIESRIADGEARASLYAEPAEGVKVLAQYKDGHVDPNGQISIAGHLALVELFKTKNLTTILHESGHYFYEVIERLATAPNASEEIVKLRLDIRDWFGLKEGGEPTDKMLERFADSYETYMMEGKAPSEKVRSIFAKFKIWFNNVYNGIPKVQMDDQIRDIFDRMVAGKDSATRAEETQNLGPIFKDAAQAQMSEIEFKNYKDAVENARLEAEEQITAEFLKKHRRDQKKAYAAMRVGVEAGARAEVEAMPVYQTIDKLQHNQTPDTPLKLKTSDIPDASRAGLPKGVTSEANGMHPDIIAGVLGYESGAELIAEISGVTPKEELIDDMTYRRMVVRFDDLAVSKELPEEAIKAHLNDRQAYKLKLESDTLFKNSLPVVKAGIRRIARRPASQDVLDKSSRQIIGAQKVGEIKTNPHKLAERRQAKEAGIQFAKGDFDAAFVAKERERMNFELFRKSVEAKKYIKDAFDKFEKMLGSDTKLAANREMNYVNAARAILAEFGLTKKGRTAESYLSPVKEYDIEKYDTIKSMIDSATAGAADYKEVSFEKFVEMTEAVNAVWDLSKREKLIEVNGQLIDRQIAIADLTVAINQIPSKLDKNEYVGFATEGEKNKMFLLGVQARGRRVESWIERMDKKNPTGPFHNYFWNVVNEATVKFGIEKTKFLSEFNELAKAVAPGMTFETILAPELGPDAKFKDKGYLLGAILHRGNPSNFSKLLRGYGWGEMDENGKLDTSRWDEFEKRMQDEGVLTGADYDFAQGVWDLMEKTKPEAQKAHKKMYGKFFDEVTAEKFVNKFGTYRGGYYPAVADSFVNPDARIRNEKEQLEGQENSFMFPTPAKGFTKNRSEGYARPLVLDIRQASSHMDKVLRFIHIAPHTSDVARILWDKDFRSNLDAYDPTAASNMLVPWLQRAVLQITTIPIKGLDGAMIDNFWRQLRKSAGEQIMVGNIVNGAMQITGLSTSLLRVKPSHLRDSLWKYKSDPKGFTDEIISKSQYMELELKKQIIDIQNDINEIVFDQTGLEKVRTFSDKHGYFFQRSFQNMVNVITWTGAYDQAIATQSGITEEEAVRQADAAVRQTQGGFRPIDISSYEVQKSYIQLFQMFYSYYNQQANNLGTEFATSVGDKGFKKGSGRAFFVLTMAFTIPAVLSGIIRQMALGHGLDDDDKDGYMDEIMSWFFASQFDAATSIIPFLGPTLRAGVNRFNNKTSDDDISTSPVIAMLERVAHTPGDVYKAYIGEGSQKEAIKDVLTLAGLVARIPLAWVAKPIGYSMDVASGKAQPTGPIDFARGLMTGK